MSLFHSFILTSRLATSPVSTHCKALSFTTRHSQPITSLSKPRLTLKNVIVARLTLTYEHCLHFTPNKQTRLGRSLVLWSRDYYPVRKPTLVTTSSQFKYRTVDNQYHNHAVLFFHTNYRFVIYLKMLAFTQV